MKIESIFYSNSRVEIALKYKNKNYLIFYNTNEYYRFYWVNHDVNEHFLTLIELINYIINELNSLQKYTEC